MGYLYYGNSSYKIEIDDRPLAHLKIAMMSLLRDGKCFPFSFDRPTSQGSGRETLWISPSSELRFRYNGSRPPRINGPWVGAIIATVDAQTGLRMVPEPSRADAAVSVLASA